MTTHSRGGARDLIILAERMSIPVDEAMRQVAQLIADERPTEPAAPEPDPAAREPIESPAPAPAPALA